MSLLEKIKCIDLEAAGKLAANEAGGYPTDQEVASLTPEKLHELFPGPERKELRLAIWNVISSKREADTFKKELQDQFKSLREAVDAQKSKNVSDLKELTNKVDKIQTTLQTVLDSIQQLSAGKKPGKKCEEDDSQQTLKSEPSGTPTPRGKKNVQSEEDESRKPLNVPLLYQTIVSGKTFGAHYQLMDGIKSKLLGVDFQENSVNHSVTILFCPIISRIAADVSAAMSEVKDNKPIILVLMNHAHEPRCVATQRTWDAYPNIVWFVHVFYHEAKSGLIKCRENEEAIHRIAEKLRVYCPNILKDSPDSAQGKSHGFKQPHDVTLSNQSVCDDSLSNQPPCGDSRKSTWLWNIFQNDNKKN